MKKKIIAVVGATRAPGRGLIRAILEDRSGEFVARAVVRDLHNEEARYLTAQGIEVVAGRIGLEASLRLAFTGVYGAFYTALPDDQSLPEKKIGEGTTMARAAKAAGVQHVVWATLDDGNQIPDLEEEEVTPTVAIGGGHARRADVRAEIARAFFALGVPTTFLQASWHAAAVTGRGAEEIGKCAYGIFRSPDLLNKTVSIDAETLARELARASARPAPTPEARARTRKVLIGGGAAALAAALVLVLVLGHRSDPRQSDIAPASAAVAVAPPEPTTPATTPPPPAPRPPEPPAPPRPKVAAAATFNSHGLRAPAAPAARPQPEHETATIAMRSAPLPAVSRSHGHPRHRRGSKLAYVEPAPAVDEQPRAIPPAEPSPPARATPAADVRKPPAEARKPDPEPPPAPDPEPARAVEKPRPAVAVPRPAPTPAPAAEPAQVPPGTVDPKSVAATVRAHATEVQQCFERALMDGAELHGHLNVAATIDSTGHVLSVSPTSSIEGGARLQTCVLAAFKNWVFAPPSGGVKGRIKYSFSFE